MNLSFNNDQSKVGYEIAQTKDEQQRALYAAFELVRKSKRLGLETREWSIKANVSTMTLLERLKFEKQGKKTDMKILQKQLWELACCENQILGALRVYMNETSDLLNQLKPLNPPLSSEHLRPFQEAMMTDRRLTVEAMEPLTKTVSKLTAYKLDLAHRDQVQNFNYKPSI